MAKFGDKSVLPPITKSVFPEVRACMEEKDFHINIIKGKKKVTGLWTAFIMAIKFNILLLQY